jgi:aspartate/methionine/tyrosine aminotransferase
MKRQGTDVLVLSGGEPDFNTPSVIKQVAIDAINNNFTHYTPAAGIMELREKIAKKLWEDNGIKADPKTDIIVTPSGKLALYQAIVAFAEAGDEVLLLEPNWVSYKEIVKMSGATCVSVPLSIENNFKITREVLESKLTSNTKMLIICNPCNPTGRVFTREEIEIIADFIYTHDLLLISDEIYEKLVYDDNKHISVASIEKVRDRIITINGFSKGFAMTGWRLGYSVASANLTRAMMKLQESTVTTANSITQKAAAVAFECTKDVAFMVADYKRRRDFIVNGLNEISCIDCPMPEGAFYIFPRINFKGMNSFELCDYILEQANVLVAPGDVFGAGGKKCIRIAYPASMETLEKTLERFKNIFS